MIARVIVVCLAAYGAAAASDGWVPVPGGAFRGTQIRIDAFEMADHPVTNAEYKLFVDAAKYPPPVHWEKGAIPAGMESWPVIFVNRADAAACAKWMTARDKRVYRLPTASEFQYAAAAGESGAQYPWGDQPPESRANFDPGGRRNLGEWRKHLRPVKSYKPNGWGLYDMAGNVFQMVDRYGDNTAPGSYTFRAVQPYDREAAFGGGSWARSARLLRVGVFGSSSSGLRTPELGFRMVREPAGSTHFRRQPRTVVAAADGSGGVYVGWRFLPAGDANTGFHVYRAPNRETAGERITTEPVRTSTGFIDRKPRAGAWYRVRPVGAGGREGPPSEWATARFQERGLVAVFRPTTRQGSFVPALGDLNGDGVLDAVLKLDNGMKENEPDPGAPVELQAFLSGGRFLWRRPLVRWDECFGNPNNVPVLIYDVNADGRGEVIARLQDGDSVYLAVLDGMTGKVIRRTPWTRMLTDHSRTSSRIHMAIAYLDGKTPAIITQTGLYENEIVDAYDANLRRIWQYRGVAETSGGGSHHLDIADVDGDGKDDVFCGATLIGSDGRMRWSLYRQHPDIVAIKRILPGSGKRQVFYAFERDLDAGAYLVDALTGETLWKQNRDDDPRWNHAHIGWVSDIWEGSPGMEILTNRDGHAADDQVLFSGSGRILLNPFPKGWQPVNWTGGPVRDLMSPDGRRVGRFEGANVTRVDVPPPAGVDGTNCRMAADLLGDWRDEVVCVAIDGPSAPAVRIYTNPSVAARREVARPSSREYRLWLARNLGAGYSAYFEWEP
jgi:rhamnogalacturonan endolyase